MTISARQMTLEEARTLTGEIRSDLREYDEIGERLCSRLKEAHDSKVWKVMGYSGWRNYISKEFGISINYSYRLMYHAEIITQLFEAAGVTETEKVLTAVNTFRESDTRRIIKSQIPEAVNAVRESVSAGKSPVEAVSEVITDYGKAYIDAQVKVFTENPTPIIQRIHKSIHELKTGFPVSDTSYHALSSEMGIKTTADDIGPMIVKYHSLKDVEDITNKFGESIEYMNEVYRYLNDYLERS